MKQKHTVEYEILQHQSELSENEQLLVQHACNAAKKAYAPYSRFSVGAALLLSDGTILEGNNQENKAYPSGMCAERVALFYAGASFPQETITTIALVSEGNLISSDTCISPCGSCRQVLLESESRQHSPIRLLLIAQNGKTTVVERASDLLLFPFGN